MGVTEDFCGEARPKSLTPVDCMELPSPKSQLAATGVAVRTYCVSWSVSCTVRVAGGGASQNQVSSPTSPTRLGFAATAMSGARQAGMGGGTRGEAQATWSAVEFCTRSTATTGTHPLSP